MPNVRIFDDTIQIGRNDVSDAAVTGTAYIAAENHIPKSDAICEQKVCFFFFFIRHFCAIELGQHTPEPILRMAIIKSVLSGFHRWQRPEDQNLGIAVKDRGEGVRNVLIFHVSLNDTGPARRVFRARYPRADESRAIHIYYKSRP